MCHRPAAAARRLERVRPLDDAAQAPGDRRARQRRPAQLGELGQRRLRVLDAQLGNLAQPPRERLRTAERVDRRDLLLGGARLAAQVARVGVGEPVGLGARLGEHRGLLEPQLGAVRAERDEQVADRVAALRVRDRVPSPDVHRQREALLGGELGELVRGLGRRGAQLEVRTGARIGQRSRGHEGAAQVAAPTAGARHDPPRHALGRPERRPEHPGALEHLQRARVGPDDHLVAGTAAEAPLVVGADLAGRAALAQQRDEVARDCRGGEVAVHVQLAAAVQVQPSCRAHEAREQREAAVRCRGERLRHLGAHRLAEAHDGRGRASPASACASAAGSW
jgi:hypothetical protein